MRNTYGKKGKYFFLLYLSIVVFTIVPITVIGSFTVHQFSVRLNSEFESSNETILNYIKKSIDSQILQLEANLLVIQNNAKFNDLTLREENLSEIIYTLHELQRILLDIVITSDLIHSIEILFPKNGRVLTEVTTSKLEIYPNREVFSKIMLQGFRSGIQNIPDDVDVGTKVKVYTIARRNPMYAKSYNAFIAINIEIKSLELILDSLKYNPNLIIQVVDGSGEEIAATDSATLAPEEFAVWEMNSNYYDLKYRILVPRRYFSERTREIRFLIIFICGLLIVIAGIIAYIISGVLYNPIKRIIEILKKRPLLSGLEKNNEFVYINEAVSQFINSNERLRRFIDQERDPISYNILRRLFERGTSSQESLKKNLEFIGLDTNYSAYTVLAIESLETKENVAVYPNVMRYAIIDIARELAEDSGLVILPAAIHSKRLHILMMSNKDLTSHQQSVREYSLNLINETVARIENKIIISLGPPENKLNLVSLSFREANEALDQKFFRATDDIILESIDDPRNKKTFIYPESGIHRIIALIMSDDKEGFDQLIIEMFFQFESNALSESSIKSVLAHLMLTLAAELERKNVDLDEILEIKNGLIQEMDRFSTIIELQNWLLSSMSKIANHLQEAKKEYSIQIESAIEYLNDHYMELISLTDVANYLSISSQYLSRIFKEETGLKYIDFLNEIRLDKAHTLVKESSFSVKEIAKQTGFSNSQYFIKRFKERYGTTPANSR